MTRTGELQFLLARVEGATGADRELDDRIAVRLAGFKPTIRLGHELLGNEREVPAHSPRYSASLDAALGLVERVLPGSWPAVERTRRGATFKCWTGCIEIYPAPSWSVSEAEAATGPLALVAALVRALIAQEEASHPSARAGGGEA